MFAETCPQYLFLTAEDLGIDDSYHGARCVCSPPPRDKANQEVIWNGLNDGLFTVFSSDHAPFNYDGPDGKKPGGEEVAFRHIPNGIPGLETRLPLLYSEGVLGGRITLNNFVELTATNPAKAYGLHPRKGTIAIGSDADLVIWDERELDAEQRAAAPRRGLHALRRHAPEGLARPHAQPRRGGVGWQDLHEPRRPRPLPGLRHALACCRAAAGRPSMRLLLINPNISDSVSELIRAEAQRSASARHRDRGADGAVSAWPTSRRASRR